MFDTAQSPKYYVPAERQVNLGGRAEKPLVLEAEPAMNLIASVDDTLKALGRIASANTSAAPTCITTARKLFQARSAMVAAIAAHELNKKRAA